MSSITKIARVIVLFHELLKHTTFILHKCRCTTRHSVHDSLYRHSILVCVSLFVNTRTKSKRWCTYVKMLDLVVGACDPGILSVRIRQALRSLNIRASPPCRWQICIPGILKLPYIISNCNFVYVGGNHTISAFNIGFTLPKRVLPDLAGTQGCSITKTERFDVSYFSSHSVSMWAVSGIMAISKSESTTSITRAPIGSFSHSATPLTDIVKLNVSCGIWDATPVSTWK